MWSRHCSSERRQSAAGEKTSLEMENVLRHCFLCDAAIPILPAPLHIQGIRKCGSSSLSARQHRGGLKTVKPVFKWSVRSCPTYTSKTKASLHHGRMLSRTAVDIPWDTKQMRLLTGFSRKIMVGDSSLYRIQVKRHYRDQRGMGQCDMMNRC